MEAIDGQRGALMVPTRIAQSHRLLNMLPPGSAALLAFQSTGFAPQYAATSPVAWIPFIDGAAAAAPYISAGFGIPGSRTVPGTPEDIGQALNNGLVILAHGLAQGAGLICSTSALRQGDDPQPHCVLILGAVHQEGHDCFLVCDPDCTREDVAGASRALGIDPRDLHLYPSAELAKAGLDVKRLRVIGVEALISSTRPLNMIAWLLGTTYCAIDLQ